MPRPHTPEWVEIANGWRWKNYSIERIDRGWWVVTRKTAAGGQVVGHSSGSLAAAKFAAAQLQRRRRETAGTLLHGAILMVALLAVALTAGDVLVIPAAATALYASCLFIADIISALSGPAWQHIGETFQ